MAIFLMTIFVTVPLVLGSIVLFATFRHWYRESKVEGKNQ